MHLLSPVGFDLWTGLSGWIVSLATVLGLALVLRHERRQARSLVERSKELETAFVGATSRQSDEE